MQGEAVRKQLALNGFKGIETAQDFGRRDRLSYGFMPKVHD
jgi:hypothetical protein